jgi:GT2 family glycosyltransferase
MDLSILISLGNGLDITRPCLESLEATLHRVSCEVILIDDATTDGTCEFLQSLPTPRYRCVRHARPRGRAGSIDEAAKLARAPALCLLRPETVLMPGWLPPMLRLLRRLVDVGCVGNVQREPYSGLIDHIGVSFDHAGFPVHAGRNDFSPPRQDHARWPAVSGACYLVRQFVFTSLGGLDEDLRDGLEDIDFCLRAAEAGYRHYVANRSVIYHYASAAPTRGGGPDSSHERYGERWGARFMAFAAQRGRQRTAWQDTHALSPATALAWHEQWELGRETRRQHRQDIADARADGFRYLRKHLARPWRYNFGRVCRALVQCSQPRPAAWPPPPSLTDHPGQAQSTDARPGAGDAALFDPPAA